MIIMLDFDGVLHPEAVSSEEAFSALPLLHELLHARPAVRVVVASDWRMRHTSEELAEMLFAKSDGLRDRFAGVTPVLPDCRWRYRGREQEVLAWLQVNQSPAWLALDDVAAHYEFGSPHLYLTNYRTGLTASDIPKILQRIPV